MGKLLEIMNTSLQNILHRVTYDHEFIIIKVQTKRITVVKIVNLISISIPLLFTIYNI